METKSQQGVRILPPHPGRMVPGWEDGVVWFSSAACPAFVLNLVGQLSSSQ